MTSSRFLVKRLIDISVGLMGLVILSPLLGLIALLVRLNLGSPVLFRQQRPGLHGKFFQIVKFRTMTDATDASGKLLTDSERLTPLGSFLRATSLDELPELFNVLVGDMSLVGPRPLLVKYLPFYSSRELERFDVRPGITGLAQVSGRNDLPWDERLEMDVRYVEHLSLKQDLEIMLKTIRQVFQRSGVQVDPRGTMLDLDEERKASD